LDPALLRRSAANFDGEDETTRLARRARGWIASVQFISDVSRRPPRAGPPER
jgi:hypothetical protein